MNNKSYLFAVLCSFQAEAPQNTEQLKTSVELSQGYRRVICLLNLTAII